MRKILGVNISHNCSFAYFENSILKEYYEEDRFNKIKHFMPPNPFFEEYKYIALKKFKDIVFDEVVFISFDRGNILIEKPYIDNVLKQLKYKNFMFYQGEHHLSHAMSGYYFSKFKEAIAVITDGGGEIIHNRDFQVIQSIFTVNKEQIKKFYQKATNNFSYYFNDNEKIIEKNITDYDFDLILSNALFGGYKYYRYTKKAGFKSFEEGQLMGIAAYKNKNTNLDKNVLEIADKAQKETLQEIIELIERAKTYSDCKNIILSGGYHLNCANNFKLVKHFPELNFFVDPIPYDGGMAVGAAYYYENYLQ